jgi:hypothetical protein
MTCWLLWLTPMLAEVTPDTVHQARPPGRKVGLLRRIIRDFDRIDERFIEPQHYNFTVMLQGTYTYDHYRLLSESGQSIELAADASIKMGPFFGWKWVFGGYTFSLSHSNFSKNKTEIDISASSSRIGIDIFYRRTGSDYRLYNAKMPGFPFADMLNGAMFDGVSVGVTGFNVYYIFNHRHFSYPAAFSQSTCQKVSCGSWLAGLGYTKNTLDMDYDKLQALFDSRYAPYKVEVDSGLRFNSVRYHDLIFSGGYAYNWVFARNWLLGISAQLGLGYKNSRADIEENFVKKQFKDLSINNFNFSAVGRLGVVYNNTRWYAGLSIIMRSNNKHQASFSGNNKLGTTNIYIGYNFGLRKEYRK